MTQERITYIVSDLHVGGGARDPGDDHVYHDDQLVRFVAELAASADGKAGKLELFFNGDFLEFAQTDTGAFKLVYENAWCNTFESRTKLNTIIAGHPDIFQALADFQQDGNLVTIAAGNHDVDLYWPSVQERIREVAGPRVQFELGQEWIARFDGKLQIGHGHMHDVANRFRDWKHPFVTLPFGAERLEMCPGTLFMVKFVNHLEAEYPFADNLLPVTKLASVLLSDDKKGFMSVGWTFSRFLANTSHRELGLASDDNVGERLVARFRFSPDRFERLRQTLESAGLQAEADRLTPATLSEDSLASTMFALLGRIDNDTWSALFELPPSTVTLGEGSVTLSAILKANFVDGREELRTVARNRAAAVKPEVIVMGHTHQPDFDRFDGCVYFNPGSWTRYLELDSTAKVTLDDLRDESRYPYQLNAVRVERINGTLASDMITIDSSPRR